MKVLNDWYISLQFKPKQLSLLHILASVVSNSPPKAILKPSILHAEPLLARLAPHARKCLARTLVEHTPSCTSPAQAEGGRETDKTVDVVAQLITRAFAACSAELNAVCSSVNEARCSAFCTVPRARCSCMLPCSTATCCSMPPACHDDRHLRTNTHQEHNTR